MDVIAETTAGRLRGSAASGVVAFRGVAYAQAPMARRFRSPLPPMPWIGVRDAANPGPAPIQTVAGPPSWVYQQPTDMAEDCLSLNVWSPTGADRRPVVVWIHGGGFRTGSNALPLFDGAHMAATADVVVVSINYRNSALGWLSHPDLKDEETGATGNWALLDQAAALRWVRDNVASFGGDPRNVTVMGQSGGAINAVMLGQEPATRGLYHKLILLSPPYIAPPAMPDAADAARLAEDLAQEFGTTVAGLRDVPAQALHGAEIKQWMSRRVQMRTGRLLRGPVVDGVSLTAWPAQRLLPDVPILIGYTRTEGTFWTELIDPESGKPLTPPLGDDDAIGKATLGVANAVLDLGDRLPAPELVAHFKRCLADESLPAEPRHVFAEVVGDALLRHYGVRAAARAAKRKDAQVYMYDYALPVLPPGRGTPHCAELPLLFRCFDQPAYRKKVGAGPLQEALSMAMIEAVGSFARDGHPFSSRLLAWPTFDPTAATVMTLGDRGEVGVVARLPKARQLDILDRVALEPGAVE